MISHCRLESRAGGGEADGARPLPAAAGDTCTSSWKVTPPPPERELPPLLRPAQPPPPLAVRPLDEADDCELDDDSRWKP